MTDPREPMPAATRAAIWALSNGRCYFPACTEPVVKEVRPKVFQKNAVITHIYGTHPHAPRYSGLPAGADRNSYEFLMLLCYPHFNEVTDKNRGAKDYPADTLMRIKAEHEGEHARTSPSGRRFE